MVESCEAPLSQLQMVLADLGSNTYREALAINSLHQIFQRIGARIDPRRRLAHFPECPCRSRANPSTHSTQLPTRPAFGRGGCGFCFPIPNGRGGNPCCSPQVGRSHTACFSFCSNTYTESFNSSIHLNTPAAQFRCRSIHKVAFSNIIYILCIKSTSVVTYL